MKKLSTVLIAFSLNFLLCEVHGDESKALMKKEMKESKEWAKSQRSDVLKEIEEKTIAVDDLLPTKDKGKEFSSEEIKQRMKNPVETVEAKDLQDFVKASDKKESFEGTEPFFTLGSLIVENPDRHIDILTKETKTTPSEESLVTCKEVGSYQIAFVQKRTVTVTEEVRKTTKHCHGHEKIKKYYWEKDAKDKVKEEKKHLAKDASVRSFEAYIDKGSCLKDYRVVSKWTHHDDISCDRTWMEEIVVQPSIEKDSWSTELPDLLARIEANSNCRLLYSRVLDGPGIQSIAGKAIYRDLWEQQLFFSCEPYEESPCVKLRQAGGSLISKKCLKNTDFGECDLWLKTYEMGKKAEYQTTTHKFEKEEIAGLDSTEASYEMNGDFAQVLATLSAFADLKKDIEDSGTEFNENEARVFNGDRYTCLRSLFGGDIYDCCKKMDGLAVSTYLAKCSISELTLSKKRQEGKCHYVGSKKLNLGLQSEHVYCCFPTKLDRIIQEDGRVQLKIDWGNADKPNCRGFRLEELKKLDFSKIDLSEFVEDFKIDKEDLTRRIKSTISQVQNNETDARLKTQEITEKQENRGIDNAT